MTPRLTEHLDKQIRCAVDHLRLFKEIGHAIDVTADADATDNPVKIAIEGRAEMSDEVERAQSRRLLSLITSKTSLFD